MPQPPTTPLPPPDPQAIRGSVARSGRDPANDNAAQWGYLCAFLFPLIGLILGIVLWTRGDNRAANVIGLSVLVALVSGALFMLMGAD